jgi:hypothetical protein
VCFYWGNILIFFFSIVKQTFPDEIIDLERSVRTLDLTHPQIGKQFFFPSLSHFGYKNLCFKVVVMISTSKRNAIVILVDDFILLLINLFS